jgi:hypothetical protein
LSRGSRRSARGAGAAAGKLPENDPLRAQLSALADKADTIRKQIVATKEGGAITGEERLREHMDQLYGALMSYEGKPADTLVAYNRRARTRTGRCRERLQHVARRRAGRGERRAQGQGDAGNRAARARAGRVAFLGRPGHARGPGARLSRATNAHFHQGLLRQPFFISAIRRERRPGQAAKCLAIHPSIARKR